MKISLTNKEVEWLKVACRTAITDRKCPDSIYKKLTDISEKNLSASALEVAMEKTARGKLIRLASGAGYAAASKMATRLEVTVEQATLVGSWLSVQGWLSPVTLLDVLRKWDTWYPKALAAEATPVKGNNGYTRQVNAGGSASNSERRKPGF